MRIKNQIRFVFILFLMALMVVVLYSGHLFNRNYREMARRVACRSIMMELANLIIQYRKNNEVSNHENVLNLIDMEKYQCPSGLINKVRRPTYVLVEKGSGLIIQDKLENHDCSNMWFVDLPDIQHTLIVDDQSNITWK